MSVFPGNFVIRWLYSVLLLLCSPLLLAWLALRARRSGGQWDVWRGARFGRFQGERATAGAIWVHAVSLGETRAAQPLVRALLDRGHQVLLTHFTATGRAEGRRLFASELASGQLQQAWQPYDFPWATRRFVAHFRPVVGVLIERELWPNLVHAVRRAGVPLILASARMSESSLRQNLRLGRLMRETYAGLTSTYAQSWADAQRLERMGASNVSVSGNFKFDLHPDGDRVARGRLFAARVGRPVVVIASTREGEDPGFVQAILRQVQRWQVQGVGAGQQPLFFLIPRHPQRFEDAARLLAESGLSVVRRTELLRLGDASGSAVDVCRKAAVVLGDTLGEMAWYYGCAQVAIVAGSFAPLGGQNFIEASALGCPVVVGPHTDNFEQAVADALQAGAIGQANTPEAALQKALQWLDDGPLRARLGDASRHWVGQHTGAVARVMAGIEGLLA
ncbi:MAG TPA: 3-deoxy-D-manno-octulosonic acid transferase [Castellaniella sp.]|uniref:3-deoxy-D-manno-octulosonic acid transferase n=1 Tax=Castellaniella sp. TaxID=1955812 RepID=UPI002EE6FFB7